MTAKSISVLVVDDSPLIRQVIRKLLLADPAINFVDAAPNGKLALRKIAKLDPDVVTLDVEMPEMGGLATLKEIMRLYPRPVIMLSAHTSRGADKTIKALELGAVDFIEKPGGRLSRDILAIGDELLGKIKAVAGYSKPGTPRKQTERKTAHAAVAVGGKLISSEQSPVVIAIGASTGGTEAIKNVLGPLPPDFPGAVLIVQHMPEGFTKSFADRLNEICQLEVKEAAPRDVIKPGRVLVAPGHSHMVARVGEYGPYVDTNRGTQVSGHRPSVDVLFDSVAASFGVSAIGVQLTGMGRDGADGLKKMFDAGAITIAQDEKSSVVFSMPKSAIDLGAVKIISGLNQIAGIIIKSVGWATEGRNNNSQSSTMIESAR